MLLLDDENLPRHECLKSCDMMWSCSYVCAVSGGGACVMVCCGGVVVRGVAWLSVCG